MCEGASWVGRGSFTGVEFVVVAGAGVAQAGTVAGVADDEGTLLEEVCRRPTAEVGCVGPERLGRLRGREELTMKGVPNLPGRETGLLANAERSLATSCMSWSWPLSLCGASPGWVLSLGFSGEESWESSSEKSLRMALMMALTRSSKECLHLPFDE